MGKLLDTKDTIGDRIRKIRTVKGMNQNSFAQQIGAVASSTISAYEKGQIFQIPKETLAIIAEIGGVSVDDLESGGTRFDEIIGKKAEQFEDRKRIRDDRKYSLNPSIGDIDLLIQRLDSFKEFIDKTTGKLTDQKEQMNLFPTLSETERRLLEAFRALPANRQMKIVADAEDWKDTLMQSDKGKETTKS